MIGLITCLKFKTFMQLRQILPSTIIIFTEN